MNGTRSLQQLLVHLILLLFCISASHAKRKEELDLEKPYRRRSLLNIFEAAELRKNLAQQRAPYEDPFRNEPRANNVPSRANNADLQREFRRNRTQKRQGRDAHEPAPEPEPEPEPMEIEPVAMDQLMEVIVMDEPYYGKGRGYYKRGKGKGSSSSKSKSRSKGKGKGKGKGGSTMSSRSMMRMMKKPFFTPFPTFAPSPQVTMDTSPPTNPIITEKPTCAPNTGVFPPDVSGFFGQPTGNGSDLQNELNNALNEIQVPSEFDEQCVERL